MVWEQFCSLISLQFSSLVPALNCKPLGLGRPCEKPTLPVSLSPTLKHLLKEQKISYPMHVSGHGMVGWMQRNACAKLSETIWLAAGG